ncbi:MAG: YicC family protein [Flavobacteriaceae bacterium]|nr:YicC family protein [Flavobacteriaceae bacterium]
MILSMTGFGKGETQFSNKKITVEIRTLNSKNIDLNFRTPHSYRELESSMRGEINKKLVRGKIDVSVFVDNSGSATNTILNKEVIQNYLAQLNDIHQGDTTELLKMAVRLPDALKTEKEAIDEKEKEALLSLFTSTLEKVNQHREDEGLALKKDFSLRLGAIDQLLKDVIAIDPERKERVTEKLTTSLAQLKLEVDQNRLEQELIYYLEKYDITEEKVRLANHLEYFDEIMDQDAANGKKLGFIAQEMGREINTIGSKANHAGLQKIVVQMKDELEKIKEQLLNVL